jgi:hypothetical protein
MTRFYLVCLPYWIFVDFIVYYFLVHSLNSGGVRVRHDLIGCLYMFSVTCQLLSPDWFFPSWRTMFVWSGNFHGLIADLIVLTLSLSLSLHNLLCFHTFKICSSKYGRDCNVCFYFNHWFDFVKTTWPLHDMFKANKHLTPQIIEYKSVKEISLFWE